MMTREQEAEAFYSGAERRAGKFLLVLGALAIIPIAVLDARAALGFAAGAVAAYVNFLWLKQFAASFASRVAGGEGRGGGASIIGNYFLRFGLLALAGYAIFSYSGAAGVGFVAALFLPVAALACEAVYEAYVALRRGL